MPHCHIDDSESNRLTLTQWGFVSIHFLPWDFVLFFHTLLHYLRNSDNDRDEERWISDVNERVVGILSNAHPPPPTFRPQKGTYLFYTRNFVYFHPRNHSRLVPLRTKQHYLSLVSLSQFFICKKKSLLHKSHICISTLFHNFTVPEPWSVSWKPMVLCQA